MTEVVDTVSEATSGSGLSAPIEMAGEGGDSVAPPTLANNIETLANVPRIIARGADWFRTEGTQESPGTVVCTVTGSTRRHGVGEVQLGTPLREVIEEIGGGPQDGRRIKAVLPGVAQGFIPESLLDTPVSYEGLAGIGSGLGSAGFIVFDEADDMTAVAAGVSRFLAIESCGQCTPCKQDGLQLAGLLDKVCHSDAGDADMATIQKRVDTVADGARCYLAQQHQNVLHSLLELYGDEVEAHLDGQRGTGSSRSSSPSWSTSPTAWPPGTSATATSSRTGATTRRTRARCRPSATASTGRRRRFPSEPHCMSPSAIEPLRAGAHSP